MSQELRDYAVEGLREYAETIRAMHSGPNGRINDVGWQAQYNHLMATAAELEDSQVLSGNDAQALLSAPAAQVGEAR